MQKKTFFPTMTLLLLALFALSLFMGAVRIPSGDVVSILMGLKGSGKTKTIILPITSIHSVHLCLSA